MIPLRRRYRSITAILIMVGVVVALVVALAAVVVAVASYGISGGTSGYGISGGTSGAFAFATAAFVAAVASSFKNAMHLVRS